ncbi:MAG: MFS transporter [Firmicutes bacterium]|nr:MFS transporter [Bacillota bacterium]
MPRTMTLGLGFFAISLVWAVYNSFVPVFLRGFISSTALVGFLMTLDNIAAITLQPYFGALSDRTWTRVGRRMPFILVGGPVAAVSFALVPLFAGVVGTGHLSALPHMAPSFWLFLATIVVMNIAMSVFRAPTIALMPDITPSALRSAANGIINFMGGLGVALAYAGGAALYNLAPELPFLAAAVVMAAALALVVWRVQEPRPGVSAGGTAGAGEAGSPAATGSEARRGSGLLHAAGEVLLSRDKSALALLLAIFFWFCGYSGVEAFFTLYSKEFLGVGESAGALSLAFLSVAFLVLAIPAGFLAQHIGRKRTILLGITLIVVLFVALVPLRDIWVIRGLLVLLGAGWAFININSYPMVLEMTDESKTGAYTGLYYFFSSLAAIGAPPLYGLAIDKAGYGVLFVLSAVFFLVALLCMLAVRRGEAQPVGGSDAGAEARS